MKKIIFIYFITITSYSFSQISSSESKGYEVGDLITKDKIILYDTTDTERTLFLPANTYVLWYKMPPDNKNNKIGATFNHDSIQKIEDMIPQMIKTYSVSNLKIICQDSKKGSNYTAWQQAVKKETVFHPSQNYKAEYYTFKDNLLGYVSLRMESKLTLISPKGDVLLVTNSIADLANERPKLDTGFIKAKLLTDSSGVKSPLANSTVFLLEAQSTDTLSKATTDKYGDFQLTIPNKKRDYTIKITPISNAIKSVILATQKGKEISRFVDNGSGFEYRLLKINVLKLSEVEEEEDVLFKFRQYNDSNKNEIKITENISYRLGKFDIDDASKIILDKVVIILNEHPNIKIEVISHTDSRGDDNSNFILSEKRSMAVLDYLVSKNIDKNRIKAFGKGESAIRNRCLNGVDCTDKEHEFNRRTEFNFIKH